jgi:hypothetical protein
MNTLSCHKINIYDGKGDKELVTMGDKEEKFILRDQNESTQNSIKVSHGHLIGFASLESYHIFVM